MIDYNFGDYRVFSKMIRSNITIEKSYKLFGLNSSASIDEIKTVYRQIAKKIHPDLNPDDATARDRFNTLNQAYQLLLETARSTSYNPNTDPTIDRENRDSTDPQIRVNYIVDPPLSLQDLQLKQSVFDDLDKLIRQDNFTKAVSIVDMLEKVIPNRTEIIRKQSEVYFKYAQNLIKQRSQLNLAREYLKESLKLDPHNQQRWEAVNREFNRIERMLK
jgi:curved DNA-binding protein CbpA